MDKNLPKILVVDDDEFLASSINTGLNKYYSLKYADSLQNAFICLETDVYDLILLDVHFKHNYHNGIDFCKQLRKDNIQTPIIFISANNAINYKLGAFKYGADDYICKPFNLLELKARIDANLKRNNKKVISFKDILINEDKRLTKVRNEKVELRNKEFEILKLLMLNSERVLTRETIYSSIWKKNDYYESNTIDVHIVNLRNKLNKYNPQTNIKTIYGIGYKLE